MKTISSESGLIRSTSIRCAKDLDRLMSQASKFSVRFGNADRANQAMQIAAILVDNVVDYCGPESKEILGHIQGRINSADFSIAEGVRKSADKAKSDEKADKAKAAKAKAAARKKAAEDKAEAEKAEAEAAAFAQLAADEAAAHAENESRDNDAKEESE